MFYDGFGFVIKIFIIEVDISSSVGLGLVFSEVCTPLTTWCLRAPLLYIEGACNLARSHQPRLWCGHHRVPKGTRLVVVWPKA